jgi:hypothetical protein
MHLAPGGSVSAPTLPESSSAHQAGTPDSAYKKSTRHTRRPSSVNRALEQVREILQAHSESIRKVFHRLDGRYYGVELS